MPEPLSSGRTWTDNPEGNKFAQPGAGGSRTQWVRDDNERNGAIGIAALIVSALTGSPALAGLALNALLDSSASVVLVWRFRRERRDPAAAERLERRAHRWITVAMLVVAAYVGSEGIRALVDRAHVDESV